MSACLKKGESGMSNGKQATTTYATNEMAMSNTANAERSMVNVATVARGT